MTFEQFLTVLLNYKRYVEIVSEAHSMGIDLLQGKFSTTKNVEDILEASIVSHYGEEGWDWVEWFIWENDYGQKGMEARQDGELICYSFQSLYEYLQKYHTNKNI